MLMEGYNYFSCFICSFVRGTEMKNLKKSTLLLSFAAVVMPFSAAQAASCSSELTNKECNIVAQKLDDARQQQENEKVMVFAALLLMLGSGFIYGEKMMKKAEPAKLQTRKKLPTQKAI